MHQAPFRLPLFLPAQGATETEATLLEWKVAEGQRFVKGQVLAEVDSAKSVYDFEAPCDGVVVRLLCNAGETVSLSKPVMEIETSDLAMRDWIPPSAVASPLAAVAALPVAAAIAEPSKAVVMLGVGSYLPARVVTNAELVATCPGISPEYVYRVTGIQQRRWAAEDEKPSDMALRAAEDAIRKAGIPTTDIDAIILSTTTPDQAMPSTACILQERLNLHSVPAFDLNAACSGWLYGVSVARGMILSGMASCVLTVGVDLQSRLLDKNDQSAYFIFGDGAGAAIFAAGSVGHRVHQAILGADTRGLHMARREEPGYYIPNGHPIDPWIRLDGPALFRAAAEHFGDLIREALKRTGWEARQVRWIIPHQANSRIIRAAAKRAGIAAERFYMNLERVGNTSSASIPLALCEVEESLNPGDKLLLCSVGAGMTTAAVALEW